MPGFILHLTAAQMLRSHLHEYPDFPYPIQSVNDFLIGNLLPDATDQKELSHFRNPVYRDKMMVFPDLTRFTAKYNSLLSDSSVLGYYFHLYIDRRFFKDFIPEIVDFYDETGQITDIKEKISTVYIRNFQTYIPFEKYLTEEYYYGDYTKMNTYLVKRYLIPLNLNPQIINPGINEVQYGNVQQILDSLHEYLSVTEDAVTLRCFHLISFLLHLNNIRLSFYPILYRKTLPFLLHFNVQEMIEFLFHLFYKLLYSTFIMTEEITLCIITPVCICQLHIQVEHMLQFLFRPLVAGIYIRNFLFFQNFLQ